MKQLYTFNILPELQNPEAPEQNPGQTYTEFPFEVKLSMDGVFLAVTQQNGAVKLLKMPAILNPLDPEKNASGTVSPDIGSREDLKRGGGVSNSKQFAAGELTSQQSIPQSGDPDQPPILKNDIEKFTYEDIALDKVLITTIPAKTK